MTHDYTLGTVAQFAREAFKIHNESYNPKFRGYTVDASTACEQAGVPEKIQSVVYLAVLNGELLEYLEKYLRDLEAVAK